MNDEPSPQDEAQALIEAGKNPFDGTGISARTRRGLEHMALRGLSLPHAAKRAGVRPDQLSRALTYPKVKAAYNQAVAAVRANAGQAAYLRNVELSQTATSEAVRADLNKWIAGVDNIAPIKRVEGRFQHNHQFGGFAFPQVDDDVHMPSAQIDITPEEDQ